MDAEAALKWEPATLNFGVAFDKPSMQELRSRNASAKNVAYAFKVKTTDLVGRKGAAAADGSNGAEPAGGGQSEGRAYVRARVPVTDNF